MNIVRFVMVKRNDRWLKQVMEQSEVSIELANLAVCHYYPSLEKVNE